MRTVNCPTHRELVVELARGMLQAEKAGFAELVREECEHCSGWWQEHLTGDVRQPVDRGVESAIAQFRAPAVRTARRWSVAAAVAVVVLALGVMIFGSSGEEMQAERTPEAAAESFDEAAAALIWAEGFEEAGRWQIVEGHAQADAEAMGPAAEMRNGENDAVIFRDGLEDGGLKGWSRHS